MSEILRPKLFEGTWTILAKGKAAVGAPGLQRVVIEQSNSKKFKVEVSSSSTDAHSTTETVTHICSFSNNGTLESELAHSNAAGEPAPNRICISFWRHTFYDMIFALEEDPCGKPIQIWTARSETTPAPAPPGLENRDWTIKLHQGRTAATGVVRLIKLRAYLDTFKWLDAESKSALLAHNAIWKHGYGLFHSCSCRPKPELYDIVAYDTNVASFNSIFGFRSFNYFSAEEDSISDRDRVFATFNSEFFRLARDLFPAGGAPSSIESRLIRDLLPSKTLSQETSPLIRSLLLRHLFSDHKIGQPMSFEIADVQGGSEADDPDLGVWVGVPA